MVQKTKACIRTSALLWYNIPSAFHCTWKSLCADT